MIRGITPEKFIGALRQTATSVQLQFLAGLVQKVQVSRDTATFVYHVPDYPPDTVPLVKVPYRPTA
jgi:hypothetical protein